MPEAMLTAGMVLLADMTQLDLTGPFEVLARLPGWRVEIVAKARGPVRSDRGLVVTADQGGVWAGPGAPPNRPPP